MAWLIGDSFDFYNAIADMSAGHWDLADSTYISLSTTTRFNVGKSIARNSSSTSNPALTKSFGSNEATVFVALAFQQTSALSGTNAGFAITLRDGATAQCSIVFRSDGVILLTGGGPTGSTLATYSSAFAQNVWAHFQFKIVINNSTGSINVRKDGAGSDSFSATSLNTRGGTANNYASAVAAFFCNASLNHQIDDLLVYSASGAAPNDWSGDVRAVQLMPSAETAQKQFAPSPTTSSEGHTSTSGSTNQSAHTIYFVGAAANPQTPILPTVSGVVNTTTANFNSSMTGNIKMALYAADGASSAPGTLLSVSDAVVNPGAGVVNFTHSTPATVTKGVGYWLAFLSDTLWSSKYYVSSPRGCWHPAQSYGSGFPNPAVPGAYDGNASHFYATMTITVTNDSNVDEAAEDGDTSYVYDSTNGHEDLYDLDHLAATPTSIIAVQSRMFAKKSDSGARNGQIRVKSGATEVGGTDTALSTTYTWLNRVDAVDPNTSAAWTASAVNALQVGPKVTA